MFLVSIVVISKDRHELLLKAVSSLLSLDYPKGKYEIVVVEEGDAPKPPEGVKYVFLPRRNLGLGYARNKGVDAATGEIVAFTDDDVITDPRWLTELAGTFSDPEVYGAAGLTRAQHSTLFGETEEIIGVPGGGITWLLLSPDGIVPVKNLSTCNCAYRRKVFEAYRFKEDSFGRSGAEDWYLATQVTGRYKCVYNPRAVVYHKPRANIRGLIHTFYRREINRYQIERELDGKSKAGYFAGKGAGTIALRAAFAIFLVIFCGSGYLLALLGVYSLAVLFRNRRLWPYVRRKPAFFLVPITLLVTHIGILQAELEIVFCDQVRFGKILEKF